MKTLKITALLIMVSLLTLTACKKEPGFADATNIKGMVTYKGTPLANAIVSLAFNTKEVTTKFDATTITDANGKYSFSGLNKGDYFIDAEYNNDLSIKLTSGGAKVTIGGKKGDLTVDLTVQ